MNIIENPARLKAAATYDAASEHFDDPPLAFWDRHGQRTIDQLNLRAGSQVLDVGCGTGASALPAAIAVGANGHVTAIDVSENMLERARTKASAQRLENLTFVYADMSATGLPDKSFDAVVSVFSVFFVPDMERQIAELWRLVRRGGQLAVTVWGPDGFEPWATIFSEELGKLRPDMAIKERPWERLTDCEMFRQLLLDGGASEPTVRSVTDQQPMARMEDWWTLAMGSGYRWEIEQLEPGERTMVRERCIERLSRSGACALTTNANYGIAVKAE